MNPDPIAEMEAAYGKATPGEWSWEDDTCLSPERRFIATLYAGRGKHPGMRGMMTHGMNLFGRMDPDMNGRNNLDLIVAMHRHLPALLEIARAAREVERWGAQGLTSSGDEALMELRQALAALATGEG